MSGHADQGERERRSRRGGRIVGYGSAAGAFLALAAGPALGAAPAHADIDDVLAGLFDQIDGVVSPGADGVTASAAAEAAPLDPAAETASVPLHVEGAGTGQPVVDISIGGGSSIPVAVDTGSKGLEVPIWDLGPQVILDELEHFSFNDINVNAFPAGVTVGLDMHTTVDFGNGVVAENAPVDAILFSFPFSAVDAQSLAGAHVDGILGIGPSAGGSNLVTTDLPGDLKDGVLIDEPGGKLVFGPQPATVDGLSPITTIDGAPFTGDPHDPSDIQVQIGDGPKQDVPAVFDSGGKGGWLPSAIGAAFASGGIGQVPAGTPIAVYDQDGDLLYSYTAPSGLGAGMSVLPDWLLKIMGVEGFMNTGNAPFAHDPVYISNAGDGSMTFYGPPSSAS